MNYLSVLLSMPRHNVLKTLGKYTCTTGGDATFDQLQTFILLLFTKWKYLTVFPVEISKILLYAILLIKESRFHIGLLKDNLFTV